MDAPVLYLAWTDGHLPDSDDAGPWEELFLLRPGLALIRSSAGRSAVYHALKDGETELLVAPLAGEPKMKGMATGAVRWARSRVGGSSHVHRHDP